MSKQSKKLNTGDEQQTLAILQKRFEKNTQRHTAVEWAAVQKRLAAHPQALWSLREMENSGGEPDVVSLDTKTGEVTFFDCSAESPACRRSLCYDRDALNARKEHKPANSAMDLAHEMGVTILTEEQYRYLQTMGAFDLRTSSWIQTPDRIRKLGGAVFCDRRYDTVFLYHNGADSYYAARGFRACLRV